MHTTEPTSPAPPARLRWSDVARVGRPSGVPRDEQRDLEREWVVRNWRVVTAALLASAVVSLVAVVALPAVVAACVVGAVVVSAWWWLHLVMVQTGGRGVPRIGD